MRPRASLPLLAAALIAAGAAAQSNGLFLPAAAPAGSQTDDSARLVRIDRRMLATARVKVEGQDTGRLALNVADDLLLEASVRRTRRTPWGYTLHGRVDPPHGGAVTVVVHAEAVSGRIWTHGRAWALEPVSGEIHALRQVDPLARRQGAEPLRAPLPKGPRTAAAGMDDGSVVDVLVLWTPGVLADVGSESRLNIAIDQAVATTNGALESSGVPLQINLVGSERVNYEPTGIGSTDLDRLADPDDGHMDHAHVRADALGADLVSLFVENSNTGGIAYLLRELEPGRRSFGFSLVFYGQGPYHRDITFAHELGHNMGLAHDRYVAIPDQSLGIFGYSHGYVNTRAFDAGAEADSCWTTIMAYNNRCRDAGFAPLAIPYFSTPNATYPQGSQGSDGTDGEGAPLGVPKTSDAEGADGPADAALTLARTRFAVANFRAERTDDADARAGATPIGATSTTIGDIDRPGDVDFYRLEVEEAGTLRILASGWRLDPHCALQNDSGETVGEPVVASDDGPAGLSTLCEASVQPGVYFVRVALAGTLPTPTGPYTLSVSFDPRTAGDHGDTAATAATVAVPATVTANLATESDVDHFRFTLPTATALRVATSGGTDTFGVLTELDAGNDGLRLSDDDSGPAANFRIEAKVPGGDYLLMVASGGGSGDYVLDISMLAGDDDHSDTAEGATRLTANATAAGELELAYDVDYFRVNVPKAGQLWLTTEGSTDTMGELFDADGETLASNDDGTVWPNFLLGADVRPGACFLRVLGWTSSTGPYTVRVTHLADDRTVALFPAGDGLRLGGDGDGQMGFARLINRGAEPGIVRLQAVDDAGIASAPVELKLDAGRSVHFNSQRLAAGDVPGLDAPLVAAEDDLRLMLRTALDLEALAYVRTEDGFVTTMHETVAQQPGGAYRVPFFNPASNQAQRSLLRVANSGAWAAAVTVAGIDDRGRPGRDVVAFTVPPNGVRVLTAEALETGAAPFDIEGRLGDGRGKWELNVEADGLVYEGQGGRAPLRVTNLLASRTGNVTNLSTAPAAATGRIDVPLFIAADHPAQQGFLRIVNESQVDGRVAIHAIDDAGERFGPVTLALDAGERIHFNSSHLENGDRPLGLAAIGDGTGHWRLELATDLTLTVLAYVRTSDGFVTSVHDLVPAGGNGHEVVFFNPASNAAQASWLRLVNPGAAAATVTIEGIDDLGEAAPGGAVTVTLAAGAAEKLTAAELERGADRFDGRLGDGAGKWRLMVRADQDIQVMSLLESPTGNLTNLSTRTLAVSPAP